MGWGLTGSALASFYMGVLARMAMIHHCTWFINSLCHTYGSKTFARELSAVDNAIMAILTFGEGYHNYHHAFAADYRNTNRVETHFDKGGNRQMSTHLVSCSNILAFRKQK